MRPDLGYRKRRRVWAAGDPSRYGLTLVPEMKDQYDITLVVPGANPTHSPLVVANLPVVGAELLQAQGFHALLGRDVLSICLMTYDGANGFFSLAY